MTGDLQLLITQRLVHRRKVLWPEVGIRNSTGVHLIWRHCYRVVLFALQAGN
jgi:hypothetical protein